MSDDKVIPPENQSMSFHQEEQESHHRITDEARRLVADFHQFAVQIRKEQLIGNRPQEKEERLRRLIGWLEKNVQRIVDIRRHRKLIPDHQSREEYLLDLQQQLLTLRVEVLQRLQEENIMIHPSERDFPPPHEPQELRLRGDIIKEDVQRFSVEAHKDYAVVLNHRNDKEHIQELESSLSFIVDYTEDPEDILLVASTISRIYKQQGEKGYQRARAFMQEIILPRIESLTLPPQQKQELVHNVRLFEYGREVIFNKVEHIEQDFQDLLQDPTQEVLASYLYKKGDWQKASKALAEAIPVLQKRYEQYKNKGNFHHALETLLRMSRFMTYLAITSFKMGHDRNVSDYLQASILMTQGTTQNEVDIIRSQGNKIFQQLFDPHITRDQLQSFEQQYREMLGIYERNDAHEMKVRTLLNLAIIAYKQSQLHRNGETLDQGGYPCNKTRFEHLQEAEGILERSHQIIRDRGFSYLLQECLNYKSLVLFELGHCEKKKERVEAGEEKINKAKKINQRAVRFSLPKQGGDIFIRQDLQEQYILTHLIRIYQQYAEKMDSEESQREIADQLAQFLRTLFREDLYTYEHAERVGDLMVKHFYPYLKAIGESCEEQNGSWTLKTLDGSALASVYQRTKEHLFTKNQEMHDAYQSVFIDQYHAIIEQLRPYVQQYGPVWQTYRSLNPSMIRMIALYHDIGKIGLPLDILNKPGKLTEKERIVINMHPIYGVRILDRLADVLQKFPVFEHIRRVCLQHHERFNGQGYPHKLKGMEIDIMAQMMLLTDIFDAKSHERVYRKQSYSPQDNSQNIQDELKKENPQYSPLWAKILMQQIDFFLNQIWDEDGGVFRKRKKLSRPAEDI
jgi:HD-GYP domain-containing protein (c-di-GMP phosphodiesterase class II)